VLEYKKGGGLGGLKKKKSQRLRREVNAVAR